MTPTITIVLNLDSARLLLRAVGSYSRMLGDPSYPRLFQRCGMRLEEEPIKDMERIQKVDRVLREVIAQAEAIPAAEPAPTPPDFQELADHGNWLQLMADRLGCPCLLIEPAQNPISGYQETMPYAVVAEDASPDERARVLLEARPQRS